MGSQSNPVAELDPTPLIAELIEKTRVRKLQWDTTAAANTFISSIGGDTTLKLTLETGSQLTNWCWSCRRSGSPLLRFCCWIISGSNSQDRITFASIWSWRAFTQGA